MPMHWPIKAKKHNHAQHHADIVCRALASWRGIVIAYLYRYQNILHLLTGPAGTLFFENTEAYHRRRQGGERRVMLNLLYASHRSLLSHGRAGPKEIEMRNRQFSKAAAISNFGTPSIS